MSVEWIRTKDGIVTNWPHSKAQIEIITITMNEKTYHLDSYQKRQKSAPDCQLVQCKCVPYHCERVLDKLMWIQLKRDDHRCK